MKEAFLQFIWQFQLFNKERILVHNGKVLNVIHPGLLNDNAGPDFLQGHLKIDDVSWHGNIEIHIKSSEWLKHGHQNDVAYKNVILHVVLENDIQIRNEEEEEIPTLELKGRIPLKFYNNYEALIQSKASVACGPQIEKLNKIVLLSMLDRVLIERIEDKSAIVFEKLENNKGDWDETVFQIISRNFGFKRNTEGFSQLTEQVSFVSLKRHCKTIEETEALLFGMSGMLQGQRPTDTYFKELKGHWAFLSKKLNIENKAINPVIWQFFRMRPANFPTIRIAQFAAFIFYNEQLLSRCLEIKNLKDMESFISKKTSDYWRKHYRFGESGSDIEHQLGKSSIENIIINSLVPIWFAYGKSRNKDEYVDRALNMLEEISPENNKITRQWRNYGFPNKNAFDSQALIQLYNRYCKSKACLHCNVGVTLVREY